MTSVGKADIMGVGSGMMGVTEVPDVPTGIVSVSEVVSAGAELIDNCS